MDENLSPLHALRLRKAGHDAVAALDVGLGGADDETVWRFASGHLRTLVTVDSDFGHIFRYPPDSTPGVIWLRPWPPTETVIAALLDEALVVIADLSISGKLVVVEPGRIRIR